MLDFGLSARFLHFFISYFNWGRMSPEGCIYTGSGNYDYMSLY